jgi:PKHD-type hydroxylase
MIYSIPPIQIFGNDECAFWEGFLTDHEINKILAMDEWIKTEKAYVGLQENFEINPTKRKTDVAWIGLNSETAWLWEKLSKVIGQVNSQFFRFDLTGCYEPIQLGIYSEQDQGHYDWHIDAMGNQKTVARKLSMSLLLSNPTEYDGGELQVKTTSDDIRTLEMTKGRAWFFPSYTIHRVTPVTKGTRKSLVLWVGGPSFK